MKMVEMEDTALSAKRIIENKSKGIAAIASKRAAEIYNLEILAAGIETSQVNYTRFFIVQSKEKPLMETESNKASIYLTVKEGKGRLLEVLEVLAQHSINLTKIQSYPVLGELNRDYFHLDFEFDELTQFKVCMRDLRKLTLSLELLGTYKKAEVND